MNNNIKYFNTLLILSIILIVNNLYAQKQISVIPFERDNAGLMNIDLTLNGFTKKFIFDTGASEIVINSAFFNQMLQSGHITSKDIIGNTRVIIASGNAVNATIIKLRSVKVGNFELKNINAIVMPNAYAPLLIGQNLFSKFGKMTIDYKQKIITLEYDNSPSVNTQTPSVSTGNHAPGLALNELKIIPCYASKTTEISLIKKALYSKINITSVSQENNIPPQKAINRIQGDVTIRYFDTQDYELAKQIKAELANKKKYIGADIRIENMLPYFNYKSIPSYIEIWLK